MRNADAESESGVWRVESGIKVRYAIYINVIPRYSRNRLVFLIRKLGIIRGFAALPQLRIAQLHCAETSLSLRENFTCVSKLHLQ